MDSHKSSFDWIQFPEGRVRFSGGVRGIVDEQRHETFAVEVDGSEYFERSKRNSCPITTTTTSKWSFGYGSDGYIGMPKLGTCQIFTPEEISTIQTLIVQLIAAGTHFSDRPSLLNEYPNAHFMGEVGFKDDWALVKDDGAAS